jgi:hypothetical protein
MIDFKLPDVKEPTSLPQALGINIEIELKVLKEMMKITKTVEKEYFPNRLVNNFDLIQRFLKDIPLSTPSEVFLLGYLCGRMFAEVPPEPHPLEEMFKKVINK